jgi:hypothetical protein
VRPAGACDFDPLLGTTRRAEKTDWYHLLKNAFPAVFVVLVWLGGAGALAQEINGGPDTSAVRVRIGPLLMNPSISVTNIGIDHNVFNEPADRAPKEDFTVTVTPLTDMWVRLGPTWVSGTLAGSINWYQKYSSERNATNSYKLGWTVPGSRVSFRVDGNYLSSRDRPGFEIDTRAGRKETLFKGAFEWRAMSKSFVGVTAARQQTRFDEDARYAGVSLQRSLNRVDSTYALNLRHQLTPLTSITFAATRSNAEFEYTPERDSASNSGLMSVAFLPAALLKGGFTVGYSDFKPVDPALPGYQGFVGTVDLTYVLLGSTRFAVTGGRGVQYSYDVNQPYYVQSRIGGSIAQQVYGPLDVQVRADIASLNYRDREGAVVSVANRVDQIKSIGVGVGWHMGKDLRLAFNVDHNNRDTELVGHQYEKLLIGASLTYGF